MSQFFCSKSRPIHITAISDLRTRLLRGYPWVFKNEVESVNKDVSRGTLALLKNRKGDILAKGIFDPQSNLCFRVLDLSQDRFNDDIVASRIHQSIDHRLLIIPPNTDCYRVLNGEGDYLPGMVFDKYGTFGVLKFDGASPASFWNAELIAQLIARKLKLSSVIVRNRDKDSLEENSRCIYGETPLEEILVKENGHNFLVNILKGQKTGFFLDQRDNRHLIGQIACGMKVLNLFGYTGGFSVYAGANGAKEITTVDSAKPAIKGAEKNFRVNNLSTSNHQFSTDDAYSFLERAVAHQKTWDLIIVDPPAFIQNTTQLEAGSKAYSHLFTQALKTLKVGGIIAFASCSGRFLPEEFQNTINLALKRTKKRGIVLANRGLPADHPFPFECKELGYLKFMLLRCF